MSRDDSHSDDHDDDDRERYVRHYPGGPLFKRDGGAPAGTPIADMPYAQDYLAGKCDLFGNPKPPQGNGGPDYGKGGWV